MAIALMLFVAVECRIIREMYRKPQPGLEYLIVLGAQVWPEGQPSNALRVRCESALQAWREGLAPVIICCGGQGADEPITEAECMRRWFEAQGVPASALMLDETSTNTRENLRHAHAIMDENGWRTAAVATSDYHLRRALWIARDEGIDACGISAESSKSLDLWLPNRLRETCSWVLYFIRKL